jgi:RNA polymerase sigma factor (sigma-70 family)
MGSDAERSDEDLVTAWRGGDRRAGAQLFSRHFETVRRHVANKVHVDSDTTEIIQEVFMAVVEGKDRISAPASFRAYLLGIARHRIFKYWDARRRRQQDSDIGECSIADLGAGPSSILARSDQERRLLDALRRVPLKYQTVLELYYWEGLTGREMAEVLEVPEATARTQLLRAKAAVGKELRRMERFEKAPETTDDRLDAWAREVREAVDAKRNEQLSC